jgi:hypothetical protein
VRRFLLCLGVLLALAACDSPKEEAYGRLQRQVSAVRDAAEARDVPTTVQRLASLRVNVANLRQEGVLAEPEAQRILTAAAEVQANLAAISTGSGPAPAPAPPPAPPAAPVELEPQVPGSNAGGSIRGADGRDGEKGEKGEKGGGAEKDKDD